MKLSEIGELTLLKQIRKRFTVRAKNIITGIGDDTAVIKPSGKNLLMTTDMMVEGIHFDLNFTTPYQLGFKLVSVNVSDIYAMAGRPQYLLLDIAMNKNTEQSFVNNFFDGIYDAIKLYGVSLIGGDLSSSRKEMAIAATLIGDVRKHVKRSGAKPGDRIYVTGNLGDSACGLEILKRLTPKSIQKVKSEKFPPRTDSPEAKKVKSKKNKNLFITLNSQLSTLNWSIAEPLLKRHLMPVARNSKNFAGYATAMIDLSDGLFIDLTRLCDESRVGAAIFAEEIPVSPQMKKASSVLGMDSLRLATSGGEDYELLFTAPPGKKINAVCIGEIVKSSRKIIDKKGRAKRFSPLGYQHFETQR